jgi:hypothetical protein
MTSVEMSWQGKKTTSYNITGQAATCLSNSFICNILFKSIAVVGMLTS